MSLQFSIDAWQESMSAITALDIDEDRGLIDTCLPGWRVRDVLAHLVHIEEVAAYGKRAPQSEEAPAVVTSSYTQSGVEALAEVPVAELLDRLSKAVAERSSQLRPAPGEPKAPADRTPGGVAWDWETLLRNRALDAWMHEQDIRRAIGEPGGLDGRGIQLTVRTLAAALPFVIGKRARIEAGHPVRFVIEGPVAIDRTMAVGEDGRAADTEADPRTVVSMDSETFARLAGGREPLEAFEVHVEGDDEVASRVLAKLGVTP